MSSEIFLTLINNMALLVLLGLAYDLLYARKRSQQHFQQSSQRSSQDKESRHTSSSLITGLILGMFAVIIMLLPWQFSSGIVFDTRSILLCIAGLFFGLLPTIITAAAAVAVRIIQGGSGVLTGTLVILFSAAAGLLWKYIWRGKSNLYGFLSVYTLGWVVHAGMLLLMLTLPKTSVIPLLKQLTIPLFIIYPLGTAFLGSLFKMRMDQSAFAEKLQQANERLHVTFRSIGDGVIAADMQGNIELMNASAEHLTQWTQDQAQGKPFHEVFRITDSRTNQEIENPLQRGLQTGKTVDLPAHTKLTAKDGTEYQIADSGAPIRDLHGEIIGFVMIFRNITQEYQMREEIKASRNLYQSIFQNTGTAACIWDENGTITLANTQFAALTGYSLEEITGKKTWMEFAAAENLPKMKEQHDLRRKNREKALKNYEFTLIDKNGQRKNIHLYIDMIPGTNKSIASLLDISTERQLEMELRNTISLLRSLIDSMPDLVFYKTPDGYYQGCNRSFEAFTGKKEQEITGSTDYDLFDAETADFFRFHDRTMFAKMEATRNEEWVTYPDGKKVLLDTIKTPYRNADGEVIGLLGLGRDITELRKVVEEKDQLSSQLNQLQKMDSIGRLAGGIAHDFNNMLNVIHGYTELSLSMLAETDPLHQNLIEILNASERSAEITKKLLTFARKQNNNPVMLDMNAEMNSMLNMLRRLIGENIHLDLFPGEQLQPIKADQTQFYQVVTNLCINARDAIDGSGRISIRTENTVIDDNYCADYVGCIPGEYALLTVSDDGCGMDKETQEKIFEPFFTTKETGAGTGLGLSTVYGIVEQNNGFIHCYSEPGEGTSFKVYFPCYTESGKTDRHAAIEDIPRGHHETILVVEDEDTIRMLTKYILENIDYQVITAETPSEAVQLAEKHKDSIDLLITDVIMPEMNGKELSNTLRKVISDLKVLYISGYTADVFTGRGVLEEGMHFLEKPFSKSEIAKKIRNVLLH